MAFPSSIGLLWGQIRYQLVTFWRTPVAFFFTLALPLIMLVLFNALFGNQTVDTGGGGEWPVRQFYTGGLAVFTAVSATYTNLANMVPIRRDEGVLKRWRGTPLPTSIYIGGFVGSALVLALVGVVFMLTLGVVAYDLQVDIAKMPAAFVTFVVGVLAFAALGMAIAAIVPNASSASALANATLLPLAFISNIFIVTDDGDLPRWMEVLGDFFPLKPFAEAFQDAFNPFVEAPAFQWDKIGYIALWGVFGAIVAVRKFTWEPSGSGSTRGRRSRAQAAEGQPSA